MDEINQAFLALNENEMLKSIRLTLIAMKKSGVSMDATLTVMGLEYSDLLLDLPKASKLFSEYASLFNPINPEKVNPNLQNEESEILRKLVTKYDKDFFRDKQIGKRFDLLTKRSFGNTTGLRDFKEILEQYLPMLKELIVIRISKCNSEIGNLQTRVITTRRPLGGHVATSKISSDQAYIAKTVRLEKPLRTPIQQYLNYFSDYIRDIKGIQLQFEIQRTDTGLELIIENSNNITEEALQQWLNEYMNYLKTSPQEDNVVFQRSGISEEEKKRIIVELQFNVEHAQRAISHRKGLEQNDQLNEALVSLLPGSSSIQMGHQSTAERVRDLIARSQLESAMKVLFTIVKSGTYQDLGNKLAGLSASYYRAEDEHNMKGMMDGNDYRREMARITHALIVIVNEVEKIDKED